MKKIMIFAGLAVVFVAYAIYGRSASNTSTATIPTTPASTAIISTKKYTDGSYTGSVADAYFGNIQVKAIITNGLVSDVQFLQYPNDRSRSSEINNHAMPILKSETIQSQTAMVNVVSGATQTSQAFEQSLASALAQAQG